MEISVFTLGTVSIMSYIDNIISYIDLQLDVFVQL